MLVCAEYSDPDLHKHNAAHIIISLDGKIEIMTSSEKKLCRGIVIPSGVMHTANTDKNRVLIFLFDNTTAVANHIFLSEGRFSHIFKEQVGMTFSTYLIYQRIMKTYTEIINGKSITEASIEAGFSSSTHFAETNKRSFGLSASTIKKDLIFCKIAEI